MSVITTLHEGWYTLSAGGKYYRVRSIIDQQLQADYARWHYGRAMDDLRLSRPLYTEAEFAAERDKLRADFRNGLYDFKSVKGAEILATAPGVAFVCSRLIEGLDEGAALEVVATCPDQVGELLNAIIEESFPDLIKLGKQKKTAPPPPAPTTTPTGGASPATAPPY